MLCLLCPSCCIRHSTAKWQCWLICGSRLNWGNWSRSCLCRGGHHEDTWTGCSAAPEWLQLTASWINPTTASVYFCALCCPCYGTQEGTGGRKCSPLPCLICSHVYVNIPISSFDLSVHCSAFPSKESRTPIILFLAVKQFEILQRTGSVWKYCLVWDCQLAWGHQLYHCVKSELTAWNGLHCYPEEGTSKKTSSAQT